MKKLTLAVIFVAGILFSAYADFKTTYESLLGASKLTELEQHLALWESAEPRNPEMFIAYFNYYLRKGMHDGISIDTYLKDPKNQLAVTDPDTHEIVGYINDGTWYEKEDLERALDYLSRGLAITPNRLDMHFGQIHILGQVGEYSRQADKIIEALRVSRAISNKWLWSNNETIPDEDGEDFLLSNINDYYGLWFRVKNAESFTAAERVSKYQVELYPQNIYGYNILGVINGMQGRLDEALSYYLQAEKINNADVVVLNNIAYCYEQKKDTVNARLYYQKMEQYGNDEVKSYAARKLTQLQ